jgi:DNA transformation protein and related proteins
VSVTPSFRDYVLEQLAGVGPVRAKRMFGGVGIYCRESFFGLIASDTLYLKVDDGNRDDYLRRGMEPFRPFRDKPLWSMSYYAVPADVLEDAEMLADWGRKSVRVAEAVPPKRRAARKRRAPDA